LKAALVALRYRMETNSSIAINLIGFRKHGHNEMDDVGFTNALLYKQIDHLPNIVD